MFANDAVKQRYNERMGRYNAALRGGTPDRIPIRFFPQEAAARYAGYTAQQVACDYNLAFEATRRMAADMGFDAVMLNAIWSNYGVGKAASWRYLNVPGVDVGVSSVLQYSEPEEERAQYMREDEYDAFIDDPTAYLATTWMARATRRVGEPGEPAGFEHNTALISGALAYANYMNAFGPAYNLLVYQSGVVSANSGMIKAPLDILADKLRGYMGAAIDSVQRPADVLRACEALMPHLLANALAGADPSGMVPLTLWAHRGCVPFFSRRTFDAIFWPTLKPLLEALIARGHQIIFYAEGAWEPHFDALLELPENGIIFHIDKDDPARAAKALKGRFPLSGGLSYDVLARGGAADVRASLKTLFEAVKGDGGYMLDCSALMLSDVKPENVKAAVEYTLEHGVYSQGHAGGGGDERGARGQCPLDPHADAAHPGTGGDSDSTTLCPPLRAETGSTGYPLEGYVQAHPDARQRVLGGRPPLAVIPWEQESAQYRCLSGDVDLVKRSWQAVDGAAYNYLWTTLLW